MATTQKPGIEIERRHTTSLFSLALLWSLALHVMAGGFFAPSWLKADEKPAPPLTVTLEALPATVTAVVTPQPELHPHPHVRRAPERLPLPVRAVQHVPVPSPIVVERVEPAPPVLTPTLVVQAAPAPVVVATAPASTGFAAKPPAHFDVAYLVKPQPAYPAIARRLGIEGVVLIRVQVGTTGLPEQASVAQSSGTNALDDEALRAVRESRFEPARRGDTPVVHVVEVPIRFRLKN